MAPYPHQLRAALAAHIGSVLTPEIAARIEAVSVHNPMPVPVVATADLSAAQDPVAFEWLNRQAKCSLDPANSRLIARRNASGRLVCALAYSIERRDDVVVTIATDGSGHWLTRELVRVGWTYPFWQLGVSRCTAYVRADNPRSLRLCEHIGFQREGLMRRASGDLVVMGALRSECRWLKGKH